MISPHASVKEHYERFPYPVYPLWFAGDRDELKRLDFRHLLGREPENLWLVGCGALSPLVFSRVYYRSWIRASDLAASNLRIAKMRCWLYGYHGVDFVEEDCIVTAESGVLDACFDLVDAYGVIHHTEDPARSLRALARTLKPGALLRVMVYASESRRRLEALRKTLAAPAKLLGGPLDESARWLREHNVELGRDAENVSGLADALIHPLVHVKTSEEWIDMFKKETALEIVSVEDRGNLIVLLRAERRASS